MCFVDAHDSSDWFNVGLRLVGGKEIHLFHFIGDGSFTNNSMFPDWMYWGERVLDVEGSQDSPVESLCRTALDNGPSPGRPVELNNAY